MILATVILATCLAVNGAAGNGGRARHEPPGSGRPAVAEPLRPRLTPTAPSEPAAPLAVSAALRPDSRGDVPPAPAPGRHSLPQATPQTTPETAFTRAHSERDDNPAAPEVSQAQAQEPRAPQARPQAAVPAARSETRAEETAAPAATPAPPPNRQASRPGVRAGRRRAANGPPSPPGTRSCSATIASETNPPQLAHDSGLDVPGGETAGNGWRRGVLPGVGGWAIQLDKGVLRTDTSGAEVIAGISRITSKGR